MNATMTCNSVAFNTVRTDAHSFLSALRRFFNTLLEVEHETPSGLPADMAARLYL